ncbi:MAG: polysaccharide pyruvyl transferase family protein [Rhodoglobus sp.]|nr:polysaccharide pyruvyl transferase family protein [Rhodoglobus sp.]
MTRRDGQLGLVDVRGVEVAYWDPVRSTGPWGAPARFPRPIRNFGDLLAPRIVRALVRELGLGAADAPRRLLSIGSILHFGREGDVVWGSGVNAKVGQAVSAGLDIRGVRGPRTQAALAKALGMPGAAILGDPGLLLGALEPGLIVPAGRRRHAASIIPNLNDLATLTSRRQVVNPRWPIGNVLRRIANSRLVVGSSLHGIVVAESLGVPARVVRTGAEDRLKYEDYYLSTGRDPDDAIARTVDDALAAGGVAPPAWDPLPMLSAFPLDLWGASTDPPEFAIDRIARRWHAIAGNAEYSLSTPQTGVDRSEHQA